MTKNVEGCSFPSGAYRRGTILNLPKDQLQGQMEYVGFSDTRRIGLKMVEDAEKYFTLLSEAFLKAAQDIDLLDFDENSLKRPAASEISNQVRARYEPGLILDFPIGEFSFSGLETTFRTTIALCSNKGYSKIWTRATIVDKNEISTEDDHKLKNIHEWFVMACSSANREITKKYEADLSTTLDKNICLEVVGDINIFAVDCAGQQIEDSLEKYVDDATWSVYDPKSISDSDITIALQRMANISFPYINKGFSESDEFHITDDMQIIPFKNSYDISSLFLAEANEKEAYVTGLISGNPKPDQCNGKGIQKYKPNSLASTAEMAINIGLEY